VKASSLLTLVAVSDAAVTPARNSPTVMTETDNSSARASCRSERPDSRAMNTDVSATPGSPEIVGGVRRQPAQLVRHPCVGLMAGHPTEELCSGHPPTR
jgi:hypothetical protein